MSRVSRLVSAFRPTHLARVSHQIDDLERVAAGSDDDVRVARALLGEASEEIASLRRRLSRLAAALERDLRTRTAVAGFVTPRLLADSIALEGVPSARLRVRRLSVGEPFEVPFSGSLGLEVNASVNEDVRLLWERLLARERGCADRLRGDPMTVLQCGPARVTRVAHDVDRATLRVVLDDTTLDGDRLPRAVASAGVIAVPKFTYHFSARKLRNFGHWVLDCLPQIVALRALAPDATFLLPESIKGFHRRTLALVGVGEKQIVAWNGEGLSAANVLVLEGDGRVGGGRPLAALVALRDQLAPDRDHVREKRRRLYVSRRDAKPHRRWVDNEPEIEALFVRRGFDVLNMGECSLEQQSALFRDAEIVAGVSGAGLSDLVFAPPRTEVIVLVSDSLMRWYADEGQSRASWIGEDVQSGGELSALGDSPRFYGHVAAAFGQVSHTFIGGDQMPLGPLAGLVDHVLEGKGES